MEKYYLAMIKASEVDSNLYYIDDEYKIRPIENTTTVQVLEEHDLSAVRDKLNYIIAELKSKRTPCTNLSLEDKIETLETALETIQDVLKLYARGKRQ